MSAFRVDTDGPRYRLHCRGCGAALTGPVQEIHGDWPPVGYSPELSPGPDDISRYGEPPVGTFWRNRGTWQTVQGPNRLGFTDFGPEGSMVMVNRSSLGGSLLPFEHRKGGFGCCGPAGSRGPNLRCHGCGEWVMIDEQDCQSPHFGAAPLSHVELRRLDEESDGDTFAGPPTSANDS